MKNKLVLFLICLSLGACGNSEDFLSLSHSGADSDANAKAKANADADADANADARISPSPNPNPSSGASGSASASATAPTPNSVSVTLYNETQNELAESSIHKLNVSHFWIGGTCSEIGGSIHVHIQYLRLFGNAATCKADRTWSFEINLIQLHDKPGNIKILAAHAGRVVSKTATTSKYIQNNFICPKNFVPVPSRKLYTARSFCVSKYEMKPNDFGHAVSKVNGKPFVNVTKHFAIQSCKGMENKKSLTETESVSGGYDLINNAEWQMIARNIENTASNWEEKQIGYKGGINQGHSDSLPNYPLRASPKDKQACYNGGGGGNPCDLINWNIHKRIHHLSNGPILWDFSGNVAEWVKDTNKLGKGFFADFHNTLFTTLP